MNVGRGYIWFFVVMVLLSGCSSLNIFKAKKDKEKSIKERKGAKKENRREVKVEKKVEKKQEAKKEKATEYNDEVEELRKRLAELQKKVEILNLEGISLGIGDKKSSSILTEKVLQEHQAELEKLRKESENVVSRIKERVKLIEEQIAMIKEIEQKIEARLKELEETKNQFMKLLEIKEEEK